MPSSVIRSIRISGQSVMVAIRATTGRFSLSTTALARMDLNVSGASCIANISRGSGFNLRQAQGSFPVGDRIHAATSLQVVVSISKLGSQFSLQHFARRISREVRHEHKSTRNFVAAKLLPAERDKIVQRRC